MLIKNNIWKLFYIIVCSIFIVLLSIIYAKHNEIKSRYFLELTNYTDVMATTVKSSLEQEELVLDMMAFELSRDDYAKNRALFDKLISKNRSLIGVAFIDVDGNFVYASSNIDVSRTPNMLKSKTQNYIFKKTLQSKNMVVGRTYYFKPLKTWVLPLRKTLRDENGKVLGVLATGVKIGTKHNALGNLNIDKTKNVILVTSKNNVDKYYYIYNNNIRHLTQKDIYTKEIPNEVAHRINIFLKTTDKTIPFMLKNRYDDNVVLSLSYIQKYKVWLGVSSIANSMYREFYISSFIFISIFISGIWILYMLFNHIAKSEKVKRDELRFNAEHDELTKLPNRTYLYNNIQRWKKNHTITYNVLYLDLDNFKNINDKYGHIIGDKILVEVSRRLRIFFNKDDMLIRQGGDEFIVLKEFKNNTNKNDILKSLIQTVIEPYYIKDKEFRVGLSIGVSTYPENSLSLGDLLSFADIAMYEAKKTKNFYSFFSPVMNENNLLKADMEEQLRGAVEHSEFHMVYQPQIKSDGTLHGVEALVRWNNKKLGNVGPDRFIPIAEDTGLIIDIGNFIIYRSLKEIYTLQQELNTHFKLSINISVVQFMDSNFIENLLRDIKNVGIKKSLITLEITETLFIDNLDIVLPVLYLLKEEGIEVSLDDFGTGYSSLSILKKLPINELKIDKSFIYDILYDESAEALVNSIITIGNNFEMSTLAEGTESMEQVEMLKKLNCDIFQGYYFSKPLTIDNLKIYINNNRETI